VEQFACYGSQCSQYVYEDDIVYDCSSVNCTCFDGSEICGDGVHFDLTRTINAVTGYFKLSCSNSTTCILDGNFTIILSFCG